MFMPTVNAPHIFRPEWFGIRTYDFFVSCKFWLPKVLYFWRRYRSFFLLSSAGLVRIKLTLTTLRTVATRRNHLPVRNCCTYLAHRREIDIWYPGTRYLLWWNKVRLSTTPIVIIVRIQTLRLDLPACLPGRQIGVPRHQAPTDCDPPTAVAAAAPALWLYRHYHSSGCKQTATISHY